MNPRKTKAEIVTGYTACLFAPFLRKLSAFRHLNGGRERPCPVDQVRVAQRRAGGSDAMVLAERRRGQNLWLSPHVAGSGTGRCSFQWWTVVVRIQGALPLSKAFSIGHSGEKKVQVWESSLGRSFPWQSLWSQQQTHSNPLGRRTPTSPAHWGRILRDIRRAKFQQKLFFWVLCGYSSCWVGETRPPGDQKDQTILSTAAQLSHCSWFKAACRGIPHCPDTLSGRLAGRMDVWITGLPVGWYF